LIRRGPIKSCTKRFAALDRCAYAETRSITPVQSIDRQMLKNNVVALAKSAKVLTTDYGASHPMWFFDWTSWSGRACMGYGHDR
jgi:hypothetical protein